MRLEEWTFDNPTHPVYGRDWRQTRWPVAEELMRMKARAYLPRVAPNREVPKSGQREPLQMTMEGHPSVTMRQTADGNTVQTVRLNSAYSQHIPLDGIRALAREWFDSLRALSRGPHSLEDLRKMGHPYGYDRAGGGKGFSFKEPSHPRAIPRFNTALRKAARGATPNRAVVNFQTGEFERSWRYSVLQWHGGVTLNFWNTAKTENGRTPVAWFLVHGTRYMQPHGPWPFVADQLLPEVQKAWTDGARAASRQLAAKEAQFGEEAVASQEEEYEAGGWL
jgi:hypothetical protein